MLLTDIRDNPGSHKKRVRVGRGIGSGCGKTSGAGGKGQTARSGVSINGFEGGQMPLYRRLPKRGFNNIFKKSYAVVNLDVLTSALDRGLLKKEEPISAAALKEAGVLTRMLDGVRVLSRGKEFFKHSVILEIAGISKEARKAVEEAGGQIKLV
ncbi:MAG: 50S ribosomal protein L15 [Alphaproteobacteria bacterium]